uniref:Putative helicase MAGATAMA 3 n=1 Tax=Lygus hesperus TaxID=30085 RepID=A0A0A9ZBM3_LYGHE
MGRINVALTRARQLVVVFGDANTLQQFPGCWKNLLELVHRHMQLYGTSDAAPIECRHRLHVWTPALVNQLWRGHHFVPPPGLRPVSGAPVPQSAHTTRRTGDGGGNPLATLLLDPDVSTLLESMYSSGTEDAMADTDGSPNGRGEDEFSQYRRM